MRRTRSFLRGLLLVLLASACTDGSERITGPPETTLEPDHTYAGRVTLPAGSSLGLADLRVMNALFESPVGRDGSFSLGALGDGVQLAWAEAPSGEPVLLGWIDAGQTRISARTTAEVMAFVDLGSFLVPDPRGRQKARELLTTRPELDPLVAAIEAALTAPAPNVTLETPAILDARRALQQVLLTPPAPAGPEPRAAVQVERPLMRSGIEVVDEGFNQITITNHHRRRAVAFVDHIYYVDESGSVQPAFLSTSPAGGLPIKPTSGATSITGTAWDIWRGRYAYSPVKSEPQPVRLYPPDPGVAVSSLYHVTVVGPGTSNFMVTLNEAQADAQVAVISHWLAFDLLIPFISLAASVEKAGGVEFEPGEKAVQFVTTKLPGVVDKLLNSGPQAAAEEALKAVLTNRDVLKALLELALYSVFDPDQAVKLLNTESLENRVNKLAKVLGAADLLLAAVDESLVITHAANSRAAERWEVVTNRSKVKLSGPVSVPWQGDPFYPKYKAVVVDATGGPAPQFLYRWSWSGDPEGLLCVTPTECHRSSTITHVTISVVDLNEVTYVPGLGFEGTVAIRAEVLTHPDGEVVGADSIQVEVWKGKAYMVPRKISLSEGESQTFEVRLDGLDGIAEETLRYAWSTAGRFGNLSNRFFDGANNFDLDHANGGNQARYTVRSDAEGTDVITVDVYTQNPDGRRWQIGTVQATVKVERRKTILAGGWYVKSLNVDGTFCSYVVVHFPLVEGATRYDVYAYGFNDTAFYGRDLDFTVSPPFQPFRECTKSSYPTPGTTGGNTYTRMISGYASGRIPADGGESVEAYFNSRFSGMVVEVTVTY